MSKCSKIKNELANQYTNYSLHSDGYYGECWKDFDKNDSHASMKRAFERGMDNYNAIMENAIKSWAKQQGLNGSTTLYQIMQQINVDEIKLLK